MGAVGAVEIGEITPLTSVDTGAGPPNLPVLAGFEGGTWRSADPSSAVRLLSWNK